MSGIEYSSEASWPINFGPLILMCFVKTRPLNFVSRKNSSAGSLEAAAV